MFYNYLRMKNINSPNNWFSNFSAGLIGAVVVILFIVSGGLNVLRDQGWLKQSSWTGQAISVIAMDVSDVVERINPAVVSIIATKDVPVLEQYFEDPFSDMFGGNSPFSFRIPKYRQNGTEEKEVGGGSGFFISSDGYVATNAHVVNDEEAQYTIFTNDGTKYEAKVVAIDDVLDIALLKIEAKDLAFLEYGDSDKLRLGQAVIAIGNALGEFRNTVSTGVVSGLARSIVAGSNAGTTETLENVIQTDAAINPGNSGGPLLDLSGKVIGVNVAVASNSENIGFALPSNAVKNSLDSMKQFGKVIRPYLGVRYVQINEAIQKRNNLTVDYGALVVRGEQKTDLAVIPGSPADKAGLEEYDIILGIDGVKIDDKHSLSSLIREKKVGDTIKLKILHDGEEKSVEVKLEQH
ncbi:trypsin-like peptidase domain-containing protein [Candidatus Falkowbacteria bacterium]|nr:trypsin-like peptidase domain-containing protein [Candidatus Falkowbacteria bacterium]